MVSFKKLAIAAAAAAGASAQNSTTPSICDKYTVALLTNNTAANQYTLLTLLVKTAVLGNFTGKGTKLPELPGSMVNVPGILANGTVNGTTVALAPYFSGKLESSNRGDKPTSVNFLDLNTTAAVTNATYIGEPNSNAYRLLSHLFSYFGSALGCTKYGQDGFPAYTGAASMTNVHKFMAISPAQNAWFIMQVGAAASSFGATSDDVNSVAKELTTLFNYRCAPNATVIAAQGSQQQAICLDSSCPTASNAVCSAYATNIFSAYSQISTSPATSTSSGASHATTTTGSNASKTSASGSAAATTSGAAVANAVPGALAAMVGAVAFIL